MSRIRSNHGSNRVESLVEQGRCSRIGLNHGSNGVESWVERGQITDRMGPNRVELWVERGQIMGRAGSIQTYGQYESMIFKFVALSIKFCCHPG